MHSSKRVSHAVKNGTASKKPNRAERKPTKRKAIFQSSPRNKRAVLVIGAVDQRCIMDADQGGPARQDYRGGADLARLAHDETSEQSTPQSNYTARILIPMFRKAAALRNEMCAVGFTDDGGAINCAERILDILGLRLNYPGLAHISDLNNYAGTEFSAAALKSHKGGKRVTRPHVSSIRELTRAAIKIVTSGATGDELVTFIKENYRLGTSVVGRNQTCEQAEPFSNAR